MSHGNGAAARCVLRKFVTGRTRGVTICWSRNQEKYRIKMTQNVGDAEILDAIQVDSSDEDSDDLSYKVHSDREKRRERSIQ